MTQCVAFFLIHFLGPAVFGGEFNWTTIQQNEKQNDTVTTTESEQKQRWVMDNRSSYVANRATGVLKTTFLTVLLAPTEKILGNAFKNLKV